MVCDCHWLQHKHITYEYNTNRTHIRSNTTTNSVANKPMSLSDIDQRISDLREEKRQIQNVYRQLVQFLHANAILPINDDFLDYLQYFIREEQMKQSAGAQNTQVIASLQKMMTDYTSEMELFKKTLKEQKDSANSTEILQPKEIFRLVDTLYRLPITGQQIHQQVDGIKIGQGKSTSQRDIHVELPAKAASSKVMRQLKEIVSS